jgi:hypothetical protein
VRGTTTAGSARAPDVGMTNGAVPPHSALVWPAVLATLAYAAVCVVVFTAGLLALRWFGVAHHHGRPVPQGLVDAWNRWDAGWYQQIAERGYTYIPGKQSAVAFFPAYPMLMRVVSAVTHVSVAGIVVTIASGAAAVALFSAWTRRFLDARTSLLAVAVLLVYPYSFYLYGAVYSDAFFLAVALASFVLLESRRPWLSGLCGAAAAAARPVGIALVIGLALRNLELTRKEHDGPRVTVKAFVPALLTLAGLFAYIAFLWHRFGAPFAFIDTEAGWHQSPGPATWFKVSFFHHMMNGNGWNVARYAVHAVMTFVALAFVPTVWRRFGRSYGMYSLLAILIPAWSTKDFFSMARYVLAAFPCFAAAATTLSSHRLATRVELAASAALLIALGVMFNRGYYIA